MDNINTKETNNDAIGVDLNKPTTQDSLTEKYFEMDKERNKLTEIAIQTAVKAERLRIAKLLMYTNADYEVIHKVLFP